MSEDNLAGPSRRGVLAAMGAGSGLGLAGLMGIGAAQAAPLPEPDSRHAYDVVVIGSGMAGLAAALEAAQQGARVVVIDKEPERRMGGNTRLAGGGFSFPMEDTDEGREAYFQDYDTITRGRGNRTVFRLMAENVIADLAWLEENGVGFEPPAPWAPYRIRMAIASPGFFLGMPRMLSGLHEHLTGLGVDFAFDTKARQLIVDARGAVAGVRAQAAEGLVDYTGRVVMATGGYGANTAMLEAFSDPDAGALMVRGFRGATGDGHAMAQAVGAGLAGMGGMQALHIAAVSPDSTAAGQPAAAVPHVLSINAEGQRFVDESRGYVVHGIAVLGQPDGMTSLVFDQSIAEIDAVAGVLRSFERIGLEIMRADTLAELAAMIGAPAEAMQETIAAFNAAVSDGAAPGAEPPKATLAYKVENPPFYALSPLRPGITLSYGGIMIDEAGRALEPDGRVIEGLYAAGEGAGGVFHDDYIGGGALSMCLVMGRIAGRSAAGV